ncbi:hypothetical protein H4S07_000709 [Coemansia furcata]|uniref:Uncharacterized protein n=1 Tax=Coemansia furcata TaxID=417177 RepID=A0ACC1LPH9_9FUNG|nr:hypothetical protein H4S07_000709 [Coemansia furcata]
MAITIGGYSTLLFGVGLVALIACSLQIVVYARAAQELQQLGTSQRWVTGSTISPLAVVQLALVASSVTLVVTSLFAGLDLVGMIVLRSRMWRHFSARNARRMAASGLWWAPAEEWADDEGDGPWWQRWVVLEELVFAVRRNVGLIRLAAAMLLAMLWAPTVVQLVVVSMAGRCHAGGADGDAAEACDLMRKGTIGAIATWACWTVLAALLVLLNTGGARPQLPLPFMQPPPETCDPAGYRTSVSLPLGHKPQHKGSMPTQGPQYGYQAYHRRPGPKKLPAASSYRSSWSYADKGSVTDSGKGDSQSIAQAGGRPGVMYPPQSMAQLYHLQNQQFQSLHQIQASRMSEERRHQQMAGHVQRQLSRGVYAEQEENAEYDARQDAHVQHLLRHARNGTGQYRPARGASVSGERISQSLASFGHHIIPGPESEELDGDKASKRNTIG